MEIADIIQTVESAISLIVMVGGVLLWVRHEWFHCTVRLSCGTFRIKRKHFNSVDLTTIVSNLYYNGDKVPGEIRKEIFRLTGTIGTKQ